MRAIKDLSPAAQRRPAAERHPELARTSLGIVDRRPLGLAQRRIALAIDNSPRATAQRLQLAGLGAGVGTAQLTPDQNLAVLRSVPATAADGSYTSEGNKDDTIKAVAGDSFVVTATSGTWHHIYPRNLLKTHLENISKYFVATNGHAAELSNTAASHQAMTWLASTFSMDTAGKLGRPPFYYWKHGNGFVGVRSDYRADDPGSNVEHEKPASMSSSRYQLPRDWGKELEKLSNFLGTLGTLGSTAELEKVDGHLHKLASGAAGAGMLLDGDPYRTVEKEGKDWARVSPTVAWGQANKNYRMVK